MNLVQILYNLLKNSRRSYEAKGNISFFRPYGYLILIFNIKCTDQKFVSDFYRYHA